MATTAAPKPEFVAIRKDHSKIYEEVAEQLQKHISEHLKPGDLLPPERELVRMFGVSRSSIRDAIRRLESLGLVEPRQGAGTIVLETSAPIASPITNALLEQRRMVKELLELRELLEPWLARRAALLASPEQISRMENAFHRQEDKLQRGEPAVEEDAEFHYAIAHAAHNAVALKVVDVLMELLKGTRERSLQVEGRKQKSCAGHQRILAALKQHDGDAAEAAMRRHLLEISTIVLGQVNAQLS
jgi:GntR family transcriptional regulator, transcriptional repressor for pyruvate dehydrogenase complex